MDSLTHAFLASAVAIFSGHSELIPFLVLGSIIPDIDICFQFLSDRSPRYYIFTHGGFTHSLAGSIITAILSLLVVILVSSFIPWISLKASIAPAIAPLLAVITGAILHVCVDFLSSPGIPVLYPLSDRKYSLNIFAGPSIFMLVVSIVYAFLLLAGMAGLEDLTVYLAIFFAILGLRIALKASIALRVTGRIFPTSHILKWIIVTDRASSVEVRRYQFPRGLSPVAVFPKYLNTSPEEIAYFGDLPEVRRHRFYSYLSVARKEGETITLHDPLREEQYFWYPPSYQSLVLVTRAGYAGPGN